MAKCRGAVCAKCGCKLTPANAGPQFGTMCAPCEAEHVPKADKEVRRLLGEHYKLDRDNNRDKVSRSARQRRKVVCLDATRAGGAADTGERKGD